MNTIMIIDMTRAICRPTNRSRTIAVTMIRPTDPPIPCRNRAARSCEKLCVVTATVVASTKSDEAEQERPAAPEAIGERAPDELPDRHSNHEDRHHERQLAGIRYAERRADLGQRRQHDVDRHCRHRHQQRHQRDELTQWQRQSCCGRVGNVDVG